MGVRALAVAASLQLLAAGCAPLPPRYQPVSRTEGLLRVYLQPLPQEAQRLQFSISEIMAVRRGGAGVVLSQSFHEFSGKDLIGLQKQLVSSTLPPGLYDGLSLRVDAAALLGDAGKVDLLPPAEPLFVEQEFEVSRERSSTLFLRLAPDDLVASGFSFTPVFALAKPRRQLKNLLGFATNTRSNVVTVFNTYTMEVVDTIATGSGPMGAVLDPRREWVYVALAGDDAIVAIDVGTGEILRRLTLHFGDEPVEIALSSDGRILVSANRGSNTASIIDATSLREIDRIRLPSEPTSVVMGDFQSRAFLIQPISNSISAIDPDRREIAATLTLDETPLRGALSDDGTSLYVITKNSPNLLVIDPVSLSITGRIFVETGSASIKVDPKTGLIYIGRTRGGVAVVDPSLLMPIDGFRVDGNAVALGIDDDENDLFVVSADRMKIHKLGLINQKISGTIEVEAGGYAVVLMEGR